MNKFFFIAVLTFSFLIASCTSTKKVSEDFSVQIEEKKERLSLIFAGDIMAHKPNYNMKNYDKIWADIKPYIEDSDFAFANLEAPVVKDLPFSPYPDFNMQPSFPLSAINAGFNVFSNVNNHTNDQGLTGILETRKWSVETEAEFEHSNRPVYFCGINEKPHEPISFKIIKKGKWKILFVAVTEILNRPNYRSYLNYIVASRQNWNEFIEYLVKLRAENPCDIMVLSIHTDEPEYVLPVSQKRKEYYYELTEKCADVVWTNHPHIVREREILGENETKLLKKVIIYGNGNVISGQRWEPDFKNPKNPRDDTGDGMMMKVVFCKDKNNPIPYIERTETKFITTYINTAWEFVVKFLDDDFINYLNEVGRTNWANYIQERKKITESIKETILWQ